MAGPSKPKTTVLPPEIQVAVSPILTAEIIPSKIKRKKGKATLPVLAGQSTSYDILEDLAATKANITIGQLIRTSPEQWLKMFKGIRKPFNQNE